MPPSWRGPSGRSEERKKRLVADRAKLGEERSDGIDANEHVTDIH
jgi:hypothetical protein